MKKARILVVDDEQIARENLEYILKKEGYEVFSVDSGIKALKKISQKIKIPYFAVGGINLNNLNRVVGTKTNSIAVCRLLCRTKNHSYIIQQIKQGLA